MDYPFLKACRRQETDYTPVWIMRQAGRYLQEYRDIQKTADFLTVCKTPDLTVDVTLQPVRILGVDAAILFSDILTPVEKMGMKLQFIKGKGPVLDPPIQSMQAVEKLGVPDPEDDLPFVLESIRILRGELEGKVPLIGFCGAPFTLACYMIEGETSKDYSGAKRLMFQAPHIFTALMEKITETISVYADAQIKAGVQAVQFFDTWAGLLSRKDYSKYALPYIKQAISYVKKKHPKVPIIYYINGSATILDLMKKAGSTVIGLDWRHDLDTAWQQLGDKVAVQGNLDPCTLFLPQNELKKRVRDILKKADGRPGHIFNLGHGILPATPRENAIALIEMVHKMSHKKGT